MNDLSDSAQPVSSTNNVPSTGGQQIHPSTNPMVSATSAGSKEIVGGSVVAPEGLRDATGAEFELPKEVSSAGVRIQPASIPIPQKISNLGVKPAGQNIPVQTVSSVVLPLSDNQIAIGLHAKMTESVRWLAEWCVMRLKHLHITLKNVHGSFVRVKEV